MGAPCSSISKRACAIGISPIARPRLHARVPWISIGFWMKSSEFDLGCSWLLNRNAFGPASSSSSSAMGSTRSLQAHRLFGPKLRFAYCTSGLCEFTGQFEAHAPTFPVFSPLRPDPVRPPSLIFCMLNSCELEETISLNL